METCIISIYGQQPDGQGGTRRVLQDARTYSFKRNVTRTFIQDKKLGYGYSSETSFWIFEKDPVLNHTPLKDMDVTVNGKTIKIKEKGTVAGSCLLVLGE